MNSYRSTILNAKCPIFFTRSIMMDYAQVTRNQSSMAKFIFSLGDANFQMLKSEAKQRDISIQELLRAVIIPDWMKTNTQTKTLATATSNLLSHSTGILSRSSIVPSTTSIGRLKP